MNIKRAFLTLAALMMIPGMAAAQDPLTLTFDTWADFQPPYEGIGDAPTVMAYRLCNTGTPLDQEFEIGPTTADQVKFTLDNVVPDEFNNCSIWIDDLEGWEVFAVYANDMMIDGESCEFVDGESEDLDEVGSEDGYLNVAAGLENTCEFVLIPEHIEYTVEKEWIFANELGDEVDTNATFTASCDNLVWGKEPPFTGLKDRELGTMVIQGDDEYTFTHRKARVNPYINLLGTNQTACMATESTVDSYVETGDECEEEVLFSLSMLENGCEATNTVFYEGIPTLSQYGLAIMALLMLGVGFIGFRRIV